MVVSVYSSGRDMSSKCTIRFNLFIVRVIYIFRNIPNDE